MSPNFEPTLSRIERGETVIDVEQLEKVANALEATPNDIMSGADHLAEQMNEWGVEVLDRNAVKQRSNNQGAALLGGRIRGHNTN